MNLSAPFIYRPVLTTLLMSAILLFGIFSYRSLPVSDLPNIDYPTITVTASQPGGSPEYMANLIATPLERNFATISGLNTLTSTNTIGSTRIVLNFDLNVDLNSKEVEVAQAITQTLPLLPPLPTNPVYDKVNPSDTPIIFLALTSPTLKLSELYEVGYNLLAEPLSMINGVSQVQVYGYPYAIRIQADPLKLASYREDLNSLAASLVASNPNLPSGLLRGRHENRIINTYGMLTDKEGYESVIIKEHDEVPLYVKDVAHVKAALQQRDPYFRYITSDQDQNMVTLAISRLPGSNTLAISKEIASKLPELKKTIPASIDLDVFYDKATPIISSVDEVEITLLISLLLVVAVLFFYLGTFTETIIPSLVLPLTLMATAVFMALNHFNIDTLSLLALLLAIGFVIDDSIVVLENIVRHAEMKKTARDAAMDGSAQVGMTVVTMSIALSAVFIPFIWMPGILGRLFHEFALTIVIAIYCSGFVSLTLNPLLCSRYLRPRKEEVRTFCQRLHEKLANVYLSALKRALVFKKTILAIAFLCLAFTLLLLYVVHKDFLPPANLDIIQGLAQCQPGASKAETIRHLTAVNEVMRRYPYQQGFISIAGFPTDDMGRFYMRLVPSTHRPSATQISQQLRKEVSKIAGINTFFQPFPLLNLQVGSTSSLGEYQYTLYSPDASVLYQAADQFTAALQAMPELVGVNSDMQVNRPQLQVEIDRNRAGIFDITATEIESTLQYAYSGGRVSTFNKGINLYDLILEVDPRYNLLTSDLDLLYIKSRIDQELVPLSSVASWQEKIGPAAINHIDTFPSVTLSFGLAQGKALGPVLSQIEKKAKEILPNAVTGNVQGSAIVFQETFKTLKWLIVVAVLVIYLLLGMLYESFLYPLALLSALPVAALGGLLTLWLFQVPLSLYSVVGLIVLVGLMQKNGIMLIDFALEQLHKPEATALQAILDAAAARFRPIMMTTLAALMGSLPLILSSGVQSSANRPLGMVVVGGLLFSQVITLFVIPVIFLYIHSLETRLTRLSAS